MAPRVLVAYASKSGTTAEVAASLADLLQTRGLAAEVRPAREVADLTGYQAVVIGSGVRLGRWLPEALAFVSRHQAALQALPTAFFTVHLLATDDSPASVAQRSGYTAAARALVAPVAEGFFAGRLELSRLSLLERLMTRAAKATVGDFRDAAALAAWAEALPGQLGRGPQRAGGDRRHLEDTDSGRR